MAEAPNRDVPDPIWRVPVRLEDVSETGRRVELTADVRTREAIAHFAGVDAVPELHATFDVTRRGRDGLRVTGEVRARVGQTCVVSLEPMESAVAEAVDVIYEPLRPEAAAPVRPVIATPAQADTINFEDQEDPPEPLIGGIVDLGALATEFLLLGIDPYPRKSEAAFEQPVPNSGESGPFAALSKLKHGDDKEK